MINQQLEQHEMLVHTGGIVDATLISSSRHPRKKEDVIPDELEYDQNKNGNEAAPAGYRVETTYSNDNDARWTKKGKMYCYGYKVHIAVDTRHGFILGGHATAANRYDSKELINVVNESGLGKGSPVFADKGYSSAANRCDLTDAGYAELIIYKAARGRPLTEAEKRVNQAISKVRAR